MYEDLLMATTEAERHHLSQRIRNLANLPPRGNFIGWFKLLQLIVAVILLGYAFSWYTEPTVGVMRWLNGQYQYMNIILSAWAFIGATVLINYASMEDTLIPMHYYYTCVGSLLMYGASAAISDVAFVAVVAHIAVATLASITAAFYAATLSQYAREVVEHQQVRLKMLELEKENLQLKTVTESASNG